MNKAFHRREVWMLLELVLAVLGVLLLLGCCHRCCLPAIARGFCGRWAQLHFTHSNAHIPPLYLPKQQRLAIGAALHADDGTPRKTLTTEDAVLGTSRGVRVATLLLRVTIVKQQPDQSENCRAPTAAWPSRFAARTLPCRTCHARG